jgi:cytoskeletal protein CcmA (bactofilin family)
MDEKRTGHRARHAVQVRTHVLEPVRAGVLARVTVHMLIVLVLALAAWLAAAGPARADWAILDDTVPAGQVIDDDVLIRGTDVLIDGTINGDLLAVGSAVTINGSVSGSLVALGPTVIVNGEVGGSVYSLARTLKLGSNTDVMHNVHFAGLLLDSHAGSRIGRDLVVASVRGRISSEIGRTLNAFILLLTFNGRIGGGLDAPGAGAQLPSQAEPDAGLFLARYASAGPRDLAAPGLWPLQQNEGTAVAAGSVGGIPEWLVARLGDLAALLLVGGLALWLRPALIGRPAKSLRRKPLPAAGLGLVALAIALNGVAIAILLAVLLLVLGIWLGALALWELAFLLWGIGYPGLILVLASFALIVLYGSKAIVAYLVGTLILKMLAPSVLEYRLLPLLLGLVLYVVLRSVPIVGPAVEVIVTVFGLGATWLALRRQPSPVAETHAPLVEGRGSVQVQAVSQ